MPDTAFILEKASTHGMSASDARAEWRRMTAAYQCDMHCDFHEDQPLAGALTRTRTRANQIMTWQSSSVRYRRTAQQIRRDGMDSYWAILPATGTAKVERRAGALALQPGSASIISAAEPFDVTHSSNAELQVLTIDRHVIEHRIARRADLAVPLDLSTGLGAVALDLMQSILRSREALSANQFDATVGRLIELLCVLIGENAAEAHGHSKDIESAIRRFVRDHAHESDLNAAAVAAALGWSVRQIQISMQRAGTTARDLIREERLALAHERLMSPAFHATSITTLAHQCGFTSANTFSTAFRSRFGITPRELRGTHFDSAGGHIGSRSADHNIRVAKSARRPGSTPTNR